MKIIRAKDYYDMSRKAANIISAQVIMKPNCVLGLATGGTPVGTYKQLVEWYNKGDLDFAEVNTVNLDEYRGLPREHPESYWSFMHRNLFDLVNIRPEAIHMPAGTNMDAVAECSHYDEIIQHLGGVDLQLLGIGRDGKFAQIMAAMGNAFFTRRICLLGGGIMAVAVITMVAAAAFFAAEKGPARRRVLAAHLGFAFCFAALYLFLSLIHI